jgi:hypothetical protein
MPGREDKAQTDQMSQVSRLEPFRQGLFREKRHMRQLCQISQNQQLSIKRQGLHILQDKGPCQLEQSLPGIYQKSSQI